jgi:hypothetical protein
MDLGDGVVVVEGMALVGCCVWVQSKRLSFEDWRRRAALTSFICASVAVVFDLVLAGIMHWVAPGGVREHVYLGLFGATILMTLLSLVLGLLGRGSPRIVALIWCFLLICHIALTIMIALREAG